MERFCIATGVHQESVCLPYFLSITRMYTARMDFALLLKGGCPRLAYMRNLLVREFLELDLDAMIFIDADQEWEPGAIVRMLESGYDVVGVPYPRRYFMDGRLGYNYHPLTAPNEDGFCKARYLATGMLLIRRVVFERFRESLPGRETRCAEEGRPLWVYFDEVVTPAAYWGDDIGFCHNWRQMGGEIWADTRSCVGHVGMHTFKGNVPVLDRESEAAMELVDKLPSGDIVPLRDIE